MNKFTKGVLIAAGGFFAGGVIFGMIGTVGRIYTGEPTGVEDDLGIVRDTWNKVRGWDLRWRRGGAERGLILEYDGIEYDRDHGTVYGSFTDDSLRETDIYRLDVEIGDGTLTVCQGDGLTLKKEGGTECQYYVEGDTFYLKQKSPVGGGKASLTLTLPEGIRLDEVDITMAAGKIVTEDVLAAQKIEIEIDAGELTMEEVQADTFCASVAAGRVEVQRLDAQECDTEVNMGNITLRDSLVTGALDVKVSMGDISIFLRDSYENHDYEVDCGMGNVTISPESGNLKEFVGLGNTMDLSGKNSDGDSIYNLDCSMGSIYVRFEGEEDGIADKVTAAEDSPEPLEEGFAQMAEEFQETEEKLRIKDTIYGIEDYWPEGIGRENMDTTAEDFTFEIVITEPMVLVVSCVTEAGELDLEIEDERGREIFEKDHIRTGNYEVIVEQTGTYKVRFDCENHTGSFWIRPKE